MPFYDINITEILKSNFAVKDLILIPAAESRLSCMLLVLKKTDDD